MGPSLGLLISEIRNHHDGKVPSGDGDYYDTDLTPSDFCETVTRKPVTQYRSADRRTCAGSCHSEPSWSDGRKNFPWYLKLLVDAGAHIAAAVAPLTKNARLVCAARGAILECLGAPSPRS